MANDETEERVRAERASEAGELVTRLVEQLGRLNMKERQFVRDMEDRLEKYGERTYVSVKQIGWLRELEQRVCP